MDVSEMANGLLLGSEFVLRGGTVSHTFHKLFLSEP